MVMVEERTFSVDEAAAVLHASRWTVLKWLREGRLRGYRLGGPKLGWRVSEGDIAAFIAARRAEAPSAGEREG